MSGQQQHHASSDDAGGDKVIYGSNTRMNSIGNQFWSQATANVLGDPEPGDHFRKALY